MNQPIRSVILVLALFAGLAARAEEVQGLVLPFMQVSLSSPLQDIIREIPVKEGDDVKEGQVVAQMANEKEAIEMQQYEKMVEKRQFDAKGADALFQEKMGSKENMLQKQTDLQLAKLQHELARVKFEEKSVRAPMSGTVVKKYKESGESIDRVEKLLDIVNIDKVYIQFYVDPKLVFQVKIDQQIPVRFPILGNARTFNGTVSFVDPRIDAGSGLCRIKLLLENADHLIRPGMRGDADFSAIKGS